MDMEDLPLKKRVLEQSTSTLTNQRYSQNVTPSVQYIQYIPNSECKLETLQTVCQQASRQLYSQQQDQDVVQPSTSQIVHIEHYEAPMMLNAWTQTSTDDFPSLSSGSQADLLAKIQALEQKVETQSDLIEKLTKPNRQAPLREVEMMPIEYRIINQSDGPNNETQFEIEISSDNDNNDSGRIEYCSPGHDNHKENRSIGRLRNARSPKRVVVEGPLVSIGPNDTKIPAIEFERISWVSPSIATRKLLSLVFDRETLATHSMTGKASPAFKDMDKPIKSKLDQNAVDDIIFAVTKKCGVSAKEVRTAITTKCADENKMVKLKTLKEANTANTPNLILTENNERRTKKKN